MRNIVVAHFMDGGLVKGHCEDFFPNKPTFHIEEEGSGELVEVEVTRLKALFFVKSFEGNIAYVEDMAAERPGLGRRIKVHFKDGETLVGYTSGYSAEREVFFVFPGDPRANNERVLVVSAATDQIEFI